MTVPRIPNYPAIDINGCFGTGVDCARMPSKGFRTDLPFLQAEYDRLNILASAQSTYGAVYGGTGILEENRCLHEIASAEAAIFQWVVVDPNEAFSFRQAEEMLPAPKVLGIRLPNNTRRSSIAPYADELFALAGEQSAAVMVHPSHLPEIVTFAEKYPYVNVIVPQLCMERLDKECFAECITGTDNLYTDTSGGPALLNNSLEYAVAVCGADRVLFASGGESFAFAKARVLLSALSREDQEKILLRNALRLFPKLKAIREVLP